MRSSHLTERFRELAEVMGVYAIRNTQTGQVYVGSSVHVGTRSRMHFNSFDGCRAVRASVKLHGIAAFDVVLLEEVPNEADLGTRERCWLDGLSRLGVPLYNKSIARSARRLSPEIRQRQRRLAAALEIEPTEIVEFAEPLERWFAARAAPPATSGRDDDGGE